MILENFVSHIICWAKFINGDDITFISISLFYQEFLISVNNNNNNNNNEVVAEVEIVMGYKCDAHNNVI